MRTVCGTILVAALAGVTAFADTVEERERRTDEIAQWLPEEPKADGARIGDRAAWGRLSAMPEAKEAVAQAGEILSQPIPKVTDERYLDYSRNGNRRDYETQFFAREINLVRLLLAECLENKGRFLPKIVEYVESMCSERSWTGPAHDPNLTCFNGKPHVDLFAAQRAFLLAQTCDWLREVLPSDVKKRILEECDRRVFQPYLFLARNFRDGAKRQSMVFNWWYDCRLNWNSVCHSCVTRSALAILPDRRTRAEIIASAEYAVPFALSAYLDDGYCTEGMGYWNYGYGHHAMMALSVRAATGGKVDFFSDPKNRMTVQYAYDFQLEEGKSPAFADGGGSNPSFDVLALMRQVFPDLTSRGVEEDGFFSTGGNRGIARQPLAFMALRAFGQEPASCAGGRGVLPPRSWFPCAQVLISRCLDGEGKSLSIGIKGGHNDELHNHNDLGSYTLMLDGVEMGGDPGREVYTKRTFSDRRYESKVLNSYGHPVPVIAGRLQQVGREFEAKVVKTDFAEDRDEIVYDLTKGYDASSLKSLVRRVVLDRKGCTITIEDTVEFTEPSKFEVPYVTCRDYVKDEAARHFVFRHSDGGRSLALDVESSAPVVFRDEKIENPEFSVITRLGFSFAKPVTNAFLKMTFMPLATDEEALLGLLPSLFAMCAEHYKALDAAASVKMKDSKGNYRLPGGWNAKTGLRTIGLDDWRLGHYPGSLWFLYEATGDTFFKERATVWTEILEPCKKIDSHHDTGFVMYCSFGNARRILNTDRYDGILLETAKSLSRRYHNELGLIRSWGEIGDKKEFLVIPDNMMNLELLEAASKMQGGERRFDKIARSHANVTMKHHFRADGGTYHVLNYDQRPEYLGMVQEIRRGQGLSCGTAWARGQSWAIYGYTMMYRETGDKAYLDFAQKVADHAINHPTMPKDGVPWWDYGASGEERDSSAAAIMASGLLELSTFVEKSKGSFYRAFAARQLLSLSSCAYFSSGDEIGHWILKHGVGYKPANSEIDTPLCYGDYYYLEALLRFRRIVSGGR